MKKDIIIKINKIGKIGDIISRIAKIILIIGLVACIIGTAVIAVLPKEFVTITVSGDAVIDVNFDKIPLFNDLFSQGANNLDTSHADITSTWDINGVSYEVTGSEITANGVKMYADTDPYIIDISNNMIWIVVSAIICIIALYTVFHFIGKLCKTFRNCEAPFSEEIVDNIHKLAFSVIPMAFMSSVADNINSYILSGKSDFVLGIDLTTVILVVLIFMLAAIFKYGTLLQQESDETL